MQEQSCFYPGELINVCLQRAYTQDAFFQRAQGCITAKTKQAAHKSCLMTMVYMKCALASRRPAGGATPLLLREHHVVLLWCKTILF